MKHAIGLIAATLLSTSVYSQDYSSSGSTQNPDSTPDYRSRQSESGAPASGEYSSSSTSGYDRSPGLSGGNSSTGQSNGSNIGSPAGQDQSLTTRDSDLSGSDYRGSLNAESQPSEVSGELKGTGTADGAFHEPAAPVREGSQSEGWSASGTFSGAGPGSVTGSQSSRDDLSSSQIEGDMDNDHVLIFEDWTVVEPDSNVGAPAESEFGVRSSSDEQYLGNPDQFDSTVRGSALSNSGGDSGYDQELYQRVQKDWSARTGSTDVPATPGLMDRSLDELGRIRFYNGASQSDVGAPAGGVSGSNSSSDDSECDTHKGTAAESEQGWNDRESDFDGSVRSSGSAIDHDERLNREQQRYDLNRNASGDRSSSDSTSAPGEYGDRPSDSNYDDGHLNGNNAAGSNRSVESSGSTSAGNDSSVTPPDL